MLVPLNVTDTQNPADPSQPLFVNPDHVVSLRPRKTVEALDVQQGDPISSFSYNGTILKLVTGEQYFVAEDFDTVRELLSPPESIPDPPPAPTPPAPTPPPPPVKKSHHKIVTEPESPPGGGGFSRGCASGNSHHVSGTIFFDLLVSNEHQASVVIRPLGKEEWHLYAYEVNISHELPPWRSNSPSVTRGSVKVTSDDPLAIVAAVLTDHTKAAETPRGPQQ